jgi:hypothetical protein
MINNQKPLFVCGAPRSGTTAMQALLTADKRIVLGMERYGSYLNDEFGPQLFTKERFFDFELDPRDWKRSRPYYEEVAQVHFDAADYIGDKIPLLYLEFDRVTKVYPEAKFVVLLRNIIDICNSYQNRKDDPNDNWSLDVNDAVTHWNQLLDFIKLHAGDPRIKLVIYEDFYADIQQYEDLYSFLGLGFDDELRQAYQDILEKTDRLEQRRKTALSDAQKLFIYKKANFSLYQSILNKDIANSVAPKQEVKPAAKGREPMSLDEPDLLAAIRIFMGRMDVTKADVDEFTSLDGTQVLAKIFASAEFQENAFNCELITSLAKQITDQLAKNTP